ncbi:MAG TPA: dihydropteroate synthase [Acidobacteriota bacterium]|nr:dihydropteroate synthase [Acidobacteriota bacterium]
MVREIKPPKNTSLYGRAYSSMSQQPMPEISCRKPYILKARNRALSLGGRTLVMGILNVTPDSFSDKGKYFSVEAAVERAWRIAEEGADILDIGGESTRPGSQSVTVEEEIRRILPVLEALAKGQNSYPIPISVDTSKGEVAGAALEAGASIINDITSLTNDASLGKTAADYGAALILMHMRGSPATMQSMPFSADILGEIELWAIEAVARAERCGVSSDRLVLDPGIGFGKTADQNIEILVNLSRLAAAGFPLLVGTSRKSFIGSILKKPAAELVLGTCATVTAAVLFGAHIVRVHDVAEIRETADVADRIAGSIGPPV